MTFAENLKRICEEKGTNVTAVIKELKGSSSYVTAINKKGSVPNQEDLLALAKILDCSVMDFFADDIEFDYEVFDEDEKDVIRIFRELPRQEKHSLLARLYEYEKRLSDLHD